MLRFFTFSETNKKLSENHHRLVCFLSGGFNGYYYNFGDLLQLKGAINWYRREFPDAFLCPLIHLGGVPDRSFLRKISSFFEPAKIIFYAFEGEDCKDRVESFFLEPLRLPAKLPTLVYHVYGGGFFVRFWGEFLLRVVEGVQNSFPIDYFVISGQQIGREFASRLAEHLRKYQPDIIGCRDPRSVEILSELGIYALFSSDDAFEELFTIALGAKNWHGTETYRFSFALNMNTSYYVVSSEGSFFSKIENLLHQLSRSAVGDGIPIFLETYLTRSEEVHNMWETIKQTLLTQYFPNFLGIDLAGSLLRGEIERVCSLLLRAPFLIANSYHTAFLGKLLGIPTYLLTFNEYYEQKQSGIELKPRSVEEFLDENPEVIIKEQEEVIERHQKARVNWLKELKEVLTSEPKRGYLRVKAYYSAEVEERNKQLEKLRAEVEERNKQLEKLRADLQRVSEEKSLLEYHNQLLSNEVEKLKEETLHLKDRLNFIEGSRSWKVVETWWRVKAHPIGRLIAYPLVKLIHFFWKRS